MRRWRKILTTRPDFAMVFGRVVEMGRQQEMDYVPEHLRPEEVRDLRGERIGVELGGVTAWWLEVPREATAGRLIECLRQRSLVSGGLIVWAVVLLWAVVALGQVVYLWLVMAL
jgi:hypothetical protein